ncbi:class I SAM-dependent methyltransferase [Aliiglaciecola lipolytica]|uniref:C-methyltransferase domain-containing protein n=1 Tax=Aliiglaciecola lipolytica E3 TaxID=1127673 RepID=K6YF02_9ALTE|nr:methyltransferase domain-containing protein [Aliiglaciecola lipolytica]GAC15213.1 hypothetical protein GLIP_2588 [Aliiglaciecola lipolytica E3]
MSITSRPESLITGNCDLEPLISLKGFPVFIGCTNQPAESDIKADMNWSICPQSGCIQLTELLPEELVYAEYHSEAVGGVWQDHHDEFVDFCAKYNLTNVLEIGGSNGAIAKRYIDKVGSVGWTIVEPNPGFAGNDDIQVIKGFFDKNMLNNQYQHVVHSHVLEHTLYPQDFLKHINQFLQKDGFHIFSVPHLFAYLKNKFSNTINFEHTFLLTEYLVDYILEKNGFEIIEKRYFQEHSIFYATRKKQLPTELKLINNKVYYKQLFIDLIDFYKLEVQRLNELIESIDAPVYLFGAHIFSQFLIYFGLDESKVVGILDNSAQKKDKRLYGTNCIVASPHAIENLPKVAVIVKAGQYQREVVEQLCKINSNTTIWE